MMDSERDGKLTDRGVQVQVSTKNFIQAVGGKLNPSQEDNNRNLTNFANSKHSSVDLCTASKHAPGVNGLINGLDVGKYEICDSAVCKQSSNHSSSRCEKCVLENVSEVNSDKNNDNSSPTDCEESLSALALDSDEKDTKELEEVASTALSAEPPCASCDVAENIVTPKSTVLPTSPEDIVYVSYENEHQMPDIMRLIQKDLSEPYSIYTYRYFIHKWPELCFLAMHEGQCVGAIVCKLDLHRKVIRRGYIAMLAVDEKYRKQKIGTNLVLKAIRAMVADDAHEIVLETEISNHSALRLYENLGFVRDKRLFRYYLNGVDALRLKLWLR